MLHIVRINCVNDVNGNPRRGWIVVGVNDSHASKFIDEGYEGHGPLYRYLGEGDRAKGSRMAEDTAWVTITVGAREFNKLKKLGSDI